jgi:hypothetical protein
MKIGSWLMFLGTWLYMLIRMIVGWHTMSTDLRYDVAALLILLAALWGRSAPDKGRELDLLCLSLATAIISGLVRMLV